MHNRKLTGEFIHLGVKDWFELLFQSFHVLHGLKSFISSHPKIKVFATGRRLEYDNENVAVQLGNFVWMYQEFPHNFHIVINRFLQSGGKGIKYHKRSFDLFINNPRYRFIKEQYDICQRVQTMNGNTYTSSPLLKNIREEGQLFTLMDLRKQLGLTIREGSRLASSLHLDKKLNHIAKGTYFIQKEKIKEIEEYILLKDELVDKKEAAELLGCSYKVVSDLIQKGLLKTTPNPFGFHQIISTQTIIGFLNELGDIMHSKHDVISMKEITKKYSQFGFSYGFLVEIIKQKKVHSYRTQEKGNLAHVVFPKNEIFKIINEKIKDKSSSEFGITIAAKTLNISTDTLIILLEMGILTPKKVILTATKRKKYIFSNQQLIEFKEEYLTVKEATAFLKLSTSYLGKLLQKGKLKNVLKGKSARVFLKKSEMIAYAKELQ